MISTVHRPDIEERVVKLQSDADTARSGYAVIQLEQFTQNMSVEPHSIIELHNARIASAKNLLSEIGVATAQSGDTVPPVRVNNAAARRQYEDILSGVFTGVTVISTRVNGNHTHGSEDPSVSDGLMWYVVALRSEQLVNTYARISARSGKADVIWSMQEFPEVGELLFAEVVLSHIKKDSWGQRLAGFFGSATQNMRVYDAPISFVESNDRIAVIG